MSAKEKHEDKHNSKAERTVGDVMVRSVHTIGAEQTLDTAHQLLRKYDIRHLPVLHGGRLVGVLSSRDLYFVETLRDVNPLTVKVEEAMSQDPFVTSEDAPLKQVAKQMAEHKYGCAVVMDGKSVIGIFTTTDGMRILAELL